jgi:hypothetical protein
VRSRHLRLGAGRQITDPASVDPAVHAVHRVAVDAERSGTVSLNAGFGSDVVEDLPSRRPHSVVAVIGHLLAASGRFQMATHTASGARVPDVTGCLAEQYRAGEDTTSARRSAKASGVVFLAWVRQFVRHDAKIPKAPATSSIRTGLAVG